MVNYEKAKVYKIWSTAGDKIYIGITTKEYLSQRMDKHRSGYKCWKNGKKTLTRSFNLFEEYGIENCFIELLEAKVCNSHDELKQFEGKYIRSMLCVNKHIPDRTKKEYQEDNVENKAKYDKEYRDTNKDKIKERKSEKYNCDCGGKYTHDAKNQHLKTMMHCHYIASLQ